MAINGDEVIHGGFVNIGKLVTNGMTVNYSNKIIVPVEKPEEEQPSDNQPSEVKSIKVVFISTEPELNDDSIPYVFFGIGQHDEYKPVLAQTKFHRTNEYNFPQLTISPIADSEISGEWTDESWETWGWDDYPLWRRAFDEIPDNVITELTLDIFTGEPSTPFAEYVFNENADKVTAILIPDYLQV